MVIGGIRSVIIVSSAIVARRCGGFQVGRAVGSAHMRVCGFDSQVIEAVGKNDGRIRTRFTNRVLEGCNANRID